MKELTLEQKIESLMPEKSANFGALKLWKLFRVADGMSWANDYFTDEELKELRKL